MKAKLFFDLETRSNPENTPLMPAPIIEAPANYKDPQKIAEYIMEKQQTELAKAMERAALDPDYGRILSIGYALGPDEPVTVHVVGDVWFAEYTVQADVDGVLMEYAYSEEDIIKGFWKLFSECGGQAVGYNILGFDLPYLLRRSMALGIRVPYMPQLAKFRTEPVTDLMMILYNWGSDRYKGLKQVAKLYRIPNEVPDLDGSKVAEMDLETLVEYQTSDVKMVQALYQKMNGIYFSHY